MADTDKTKADPKGQLFDMIEKAHDGVMLGSPDHSQHMQPMAPQVARDEEQIWFYTNINSDLVKALGTTGGDVHMCVVTDNNSYHACLRGHLSVNKSEPHIDRFWSPIVGAWFPDGKDDPELTMLCFKPMDARAWASTDSVFRFGYEIAKANLTGNEPDAGETANIVFAKAA